MADVRITTEVDTSEVSAGMAKIQNDVAKTASSVASQFTGMFAVGAVTASLNSVVQKMQEIHDTSARFGVDSDSFQRVANAAKETGIGMEQVARAMSSATVAGVKAAEGGKEQANAFKQLNINVLEYNNLAADKKIAAIGEAYLKSARNADDYAAVTALLTKRGVGLIDAFEGIVSAVNHGTSAMAIFSKEELAAGDEAAKLIERAKQLAAVDIGGPLVKGILMVKAAIEDTVVAAGSLVNYLVAIANLNFKGAADQGKNIIDVFTLKGPGYQNLQNVLNPAKSAGSGTGGGGSAAADFAGGGSAGGSGGGAGGGGISSDSYLERMEKMRREQLDDESKLNDLLDERVGLQNELDEGMETRNLTNEQEVELTDKILGLTEQIVPLQNKITDAATQLTIEEEKGVAIAERRVLASEDRVTMLAEELNNQRDAAELDRIALQYDDQITKALDAAADARNHGLEATAQANEKLAEQLGIEKQIALAVEQKAQAEKAYAQSIAAAQAANDTAAMRGSIGPDTAAASNQRLALEQQAAEADRNGNPALAAQLRAQANQMGFREGAAANREGFGIFPGTTTLGNMASAGISFGQFDWVTDPAQKLRYEARAQLEALTGKNQFGTAERAQINANEAAWAARQSYESSKISATLHSQEIDYWQQIAQGRTPINNPFAARYGVPDPTTGQYQSLSQEQIISLLTKQLATLNIIKSALAPVPGQF